MFLRVLSDKLFFTADKQVHDGITKAMDVAGSSYFPALINTVRSGTFFGYKKKTPELSLLKPSAHLRQLSLQPLSPQKFCLQKIWLKNSPLCVNVSKHLVL